MKEIKRIIAFTTNNIITRDEVELLGEYNVQEEIIGYQSRTIIKFNDSDGNEIDFFKAKKWTTWLSEGAFSKEELKFMKDQYKVNLEVDNRFLKEKLCATNRAVHPLYGFYSEIVLIEENQKEYLMILFRRWQHEYQPRGAGEDARGEDVTYIHGIWENPLLTDEIVEKIKLNAR